MSYLSKEKKPSFDGLFRYSDLLADEYERTQDMNILFHLSTFYEFALSSTRLKSQRQYCKETIKRLNPHYAEGYFQPKKKSK